MNEAQVLCQRIISIFEGHGLYFIIICRIEKLGGCEGFAGLTETPRAPPTPRSRKPGLPAEGSAGETEPKIQPSGSCFCRRRSNSLIDLVLARPGKACFSKPPEFRDPDNLDFRLAKTSPCLKKASDGGDLGCRCTPEMMEMLKPSFELRRRGIITIPAGG